MTSKYFILPAAFVLALSACGDGGSADITGTGFVSLGVTDAPVDDADAVVVTFTEVQLLGADDAVRSTFTLDTPQQIDLLALQGNNSRFLIEGEEAPVGTYEQIRLIVDAVAPSCNNIPDPLPSYITIDGVDYPLVVPSGEQSGLKFQGPITVAAGQSAAYTVDFDLRQAIAERGATGCYNLRPVVRVVDNAEVGTLAGTVDPDLFADAACANANPATGEGGAVYVFSGGATVPDDADASTDEDVDPLTTALLTPVTDENDIVVGYEYEVGFLLAGEYTAAFTCQAREDDGEQDDAISFGDVENNIVINADAETTVNFEADAESPPE
ncbi:MAG: DUF4382 domain-containing protein [Abyssibacter sp.]|uniref:DUF4382 domain-containing protein n=1 Tax=Abyssibacter sp. TaxID=2320200 RepID=UPI00321AC7E6